MKKSAVYDWYRRFQNGRTDPRDDQRSGRPTSTRHVNVAVIKDLLNKDRRITTREIEAVTDCSHGSILKIIHEDLNMRRVCARWIPRMLNTEQKLQRY